MKTVMMLTLVACGLCWGEEFTAQSYVQHGLFVCYDGLENAGPGRHDPAVKIWKDLSGHDNDGTLGDGVTWGATGWSNAGETRPVTLGLAVSRKLAETCAFTVDFACRPDLQGRRAAFFSQYAGPHDRGTFSVEFNSSGHRRCGGLRFYQQDVKRVLINDYSENAYALAREEVTLATVVTPAARTFLKNGLFCDRTTNSGTMMAVNASVPCMVGGEPCRTGMAFCGTFHAFRLYTRALTEAELMINAAVDALRYRQLPRSEVRLPEGASFDAQGRICVQTRITAEGDGAVKIDAQTPTRSCSATHPLNATLALTAAPAQAGVVFAGWEGDVDLIQPGTPTHASIVVSVARPLKLTARFRCANAAGK